MKHRQQLSRGHRSDPDQNLWTAGNTTTESERPKWVDNGTSSRAHLNVASTIGQTGSIVGMVADPDSYSSTPCRFRSAFQASTAASALRFCVGSILKSFGCTGNLPCTTGASPLTIFARILSCFFAVPRHSASNSGLFQASSGEFFKKSPILGAQRPINTCAATRPAIFSDVSRALNALKSMPVTSRSNSSHHSASPTRVAHASPFDFGSATRIPGVCFISSFALRLYCIFASMLRKPCQRNN